MARPRRAIRGVLKWGGIVVLGLTLLAIALFATALAINVRDEPLTEQAKTLLIVPANPYAPEDNIYLALAGFDAPPGESLTVLGQSKVEQYNSRLAVSQRDPHWESLFTPLTEERPGKLQFQGKCDFFAGPSKSYWNDIPPRRAEVRRLLEDNSELLRRYRDLHRRRGYFETAAASPLAPVYFPPPDVRTLFLADVVLRLRSGEAAAERAALEDLQDDLRLWRTVLTGESTLIAKMLAVAYIHWDELVLADMVADPQTRLPDAADDANTFIPLFAPDDWNIGRVFLSEYRLQASLLQQTGFLSHTAGAFPSSDAEGPVHRWMRRVAEKLGGQFFKINATENLYAARAARLADEAALGSAPRAVAEPDEQLVSWRSVYNPFGKVLVGLGATTYRSYIWRAWDGAAFQRLVRLGYELRRQRIDSAAIPAFLSQHPEWSTHPGDGRPFVWDAASGEIRVQTMASETGYRTFSVHVWKVPAKG